MDMVRVSERRGRRRRGRCEGLDATADRGGPHRETSEEKQATGAGRQREAGWRLWPAGGQDGSEVRATSPRRGPAGRFASPSMWPQGFLADPHFSPRPPARSLALRVHSFLSLASRPPHALHSSLSTSTAPSVETRKVPTYIYSRSTGSNPGARSRSRARSRSAWLPLALPPTRSLFLFLLTIGFGFSALLKVSGVKGQILSSRRVWQTVSWLDDVSMFRRDLVHSIFICRTLLLDVVGHRCHGRVMRDFSPHAFERC
ncbi:hypothetical protein Mapa_005510 [Marchantia paleacea]|nr:hypothetical protein Mapa_005510 [Marchantia paleacea]